MTRHGSMTMHVVGSVLLAVALTLLLAPVAMAIVYRAQITVSETSGSTYPHLPVFVTVDNKYLAANNYIDSDGLDTQVETLAGAAIPHMLADDRLLMVPSSVPANAGTNYYYTTDNGPATSLPIVVGYGGYISTSDDADIELGNNFQVDVSGYVNGAMPYTTTAATQVRGAIYEDTPAFTNELLDANDPGVNDFFLLPAAPIVDDAFYFGSSLTFNRLTVNIGTQGVGNWGIVWEYYNGAWVALSGVVDGTDGWRAAAGNRDVTFTVPADQVKVAVNGSEELWVRARVSAFTAITTRPIGTQAWVSAPDGDILYKANAFRLYISAMDTLAAIAGGNFPKATANGGVWTNPTYTYDDDVTTGATIIPGAASWSGYLTLTYGATGVYTDTLRYSIPPMGTINRFQVDAFYGGAWNNVVDLNPIATANENQERLAPLGGVQLVAQVRARVYEAGAGPTTATIYELDCINTGLVSNAVVTGDRVLRITYDNVDLKLFITDMGVPVQTLNMPGYTTFDTATDYRWMGNGYSTMPYMASGLITVGGVSVLQYQPNDIVRGVSYAVNTAAFANGSPAVVGTATTWTGAMVGAAIKHNADNVWHMIQSVNSTTSITLTANYSGAGGAAAAYTIAPRLPDRDATGGDEMGAITWGSNPAGVAVTIGGMVSADQPVPGAVTTAPPPDILGPTGGTSWYQGVNVVALQANPFYFMVRALSNTGGLSAFTEAQVWRFFATMGILLLTAAAALVSRGHMFITSIGCSAGVIGAAAMTIYPLWVLVLIIPLLVVGLLLERSPSV